MSLNQEPIRPSLIPPLRTIYRTAHSTLVAISVRKSDPEIFRSASRLELWGAGLFEMAVPLDTVFESSSNAFQIVRQCVLWILVAILVWEEQQLNKLSDKGHANEPGRASQHTEQVTALLSTEELLPMALERWKNSVDQHDVVQTGTASTGHKSIPGLLDMLFDLLPALKAARQTYHLRLEEAEILETNEDDALPHQPSTLPSGGGTRSPPLAESPFKTSQLSYFDGTSNAQSIGDESPYDDQSHVAEAN